MALASRASLADSGKIITCLGRQVVLQHLGGKFQSLLPLRLIHVVDLIQDEEELMDIFPDIL